MQFSLRWKITIITATAALLLTWLVKTPPGLLGKMDAVGYAVCHRAPARSFWLDDRPTPVCARCSGTFLGSGLSLMYILRKGKRALFPPRWMMMVFAGFALFFALDGANSFLSALPGLSSLYSPNNPLRLASGTLLGLAVGSVLAPTFHQTVWKDSLPQPALTSIREGGTLLGLALAMDAAILSEIPLLLYPLAVLSGISVLGLLSIAYALLWILLAQSENRFSEWKELWIFLLLGFLTALLQISLMDAGRFWLTGTWDGFPLP